MRRPHGRIRSAGELASVAPTKSDDRRSSAPPPPPPPGEQDPEARKRIEMLAMDAVTKAEEALGRKVKDVAAEKLGYDGGDWRFIEVKGRVHDAKTVTVTSNEVHTALNKGDTFFLAIVLVDGDEVDGPYYVRQPFTQEPEPFATSIQYDLDTLLAMATSVHES
jgi:hypothetical protein